MAGHGESSASSYLADPTSPIPSHCAVITLFKNVPVHQLSWLALWELNLTTSVFQFQFHLLSFVKWIAAPQSKNRTGCISCTTSTYPSASTWSLRVSSMENRERKWRPSSHSPTLTWWPNSVWCWTRCSRWRWVKFSCYISASGLWRWGGWGWSILVYCDIICFLLTLKVLNSCKFT